MSTGIEREAQWPLVSEIESWVEEVKSELGRSLMRS